MFFEEYQNNDFVLVRDNNNLEYTVYIDEIQRGKGIFYV